MFATDTPTTSFVCSPRTTEGTIPAEVIHSRRSDNIPGGHLAPKGGITSLSWNGSGTLLASHNGTLRIVPSL